MAQPASPEARAVQRVRDLHPADTDGTCTECGKPWPCPTTDAIDGNHESDVATVLNELRTIITAAEQRPPDDVRELHRTLRRKLDQLDPPKPAEPQPGGEPPKPNPTPGGGQGGNPSSQPPLDQNDRHR